MGAFLASGLLHDWGMWGMGHGTDFWGVAGFFLVQGVGVILEGLFRMVVGSRVGGPAGWLWTLVWMVGWSHLLVDGWTTRGLAASQFIPEHARPSTLIVDLILKYAF